MNKRYLSQKNTVNSSIKAGRVTKVSGPIKKKKQLKKVEIVELREELFIYIWQQSGSTFWVR